MKEKVLKLSIYILGVLCFFSFMAVRFEFLFNSVLKEPVVKNYWDKTKYGELYYFSMINHFREEGLPPSQRKFEHSEKQTPINETDILTFGDSFFEISRNKQISERLSDDFNKNVHYVNNDHPLDYLAQNNYSDTTPRLVIFERVERYIPIAFEHPHVQDYQAAKEQNKIIKLGNYILEKIFYSSSENLLDAMLKRSYLTNDAYRTIATIKFNAFGYISSLTPKYYVEEGNSWLFYHDQVTEERTSFYYNHTDIGIDSICDNMANLATQLKENFNLTVLYLPVPAKYTLYHDLINNDEYNNFLPRLYQGLEMRNVKHVNILEDYQKSDTLLYYRTDGHWNKKGIDLAYAKLVDYIKNDSTLSAFIDQ